MRQILGIVISLHTEPAGKHTAVFRDETRKHDRHHRHQLNQNVKRRPGSIFERIPDGIANNSRFVLFGAFFTVFFLCVYPLQ